MMKLRPYHRIRIPNSLAFFAVLLLLISSFTGFETRQEGDSSGQEAGILVKADDTINHSAKSRFGGLKFGLLLFRRG